MVNLWATWCRPCLEEIKEWVQREREFKAAGIQVVLVNVDEATEGQAAETVDVERLLDQLRVPFTRAVATPALLDTLDLVQQLLTERRRSMPVPTSFLIDREGRLAVVYKGATTATELLRDVKDLSARDDQHRDLAVAFPGRWYTAPFPPDLLSVPRTYLELAQPGLALDYLLQHVRATPKDSSDAENLDQRLSPENLADLYFSVATQLQQLGQSDRAEEALEAVVAVQPNHLKARAALAIMYQEEGRVVDAVEQYRALFRRNPTDLTLANNLAWLLATTPDNAARNALEAVKLAETANQSAGGKQPFILDTLAAAYAAAGRFEDAVRTAQNAVTLLTQAGRPADAERIRKRLQLYEQGKPWYDE